MKENISLVFFYNRPNKYSFNALLGALEDQDVFESLDIHCPRKEDQLLEKISELSKDNRKIVVGISFSTPQLWDTNKLIRLIKRINKASNILLVAGGPHPTGDPKGTLNMGFDIVVKGEGEETFTDLLNAIINEKSYNEVRGINFYNEGIYVNTGKRSRIDLNKYSPFSEKVGIFGPIEITRGCPYACYFCQTPQLFGAKVRHRSIDSICKSVEIMKGRNLSDIRFITPNSFSYGSIDGKTTNLPAIEELLSRIKKIIGPNGRIFFGSFPCEVRPEQVSIEGLEIIKRYANNDNIIIGAQSGSNRILQSCNRGHSYKDVYEAVKITLKSGLKANVDLIFGLPGEDKRDVNFSLKMMKDLTKMGARVHAHTFMPLPQTPYSKRAPGKVDKGIYSYIKQISSKGLAYGDWQEQEKMAEKIAEYIKTGNLTE